MLASDASRSARGPAHPRQGSAPGSPDGSAEEPYASARRRRSLGGRTDGNPGPPRAAACRGPATAPADQQTSLFFPVHRLLCPCAPAAKRSAGGESQTCSSERWLTTMELAGAQVQVLQPRQRAGTRWSQCRSREPPTAGSPGAAATANRGGTRLGGG